MTNIDNEVSKENKEAKKWNKIKSIRSWKSGGKSDSKGLLCRRPKTVCEFNSFDKFKVSFYHLRNRKSLTHTNFLINATKFKFSHLVIVELNCIKFANTPNSNLKSEIIFYGSMNQMEYYIFSYIECKLKILHNKQT